VFDRRPRRKRFDLAKSSSMMPPTEEIIMGPQFLHVETYARKGAHKKNSSECKSSMFDIRDEMIRLPHACSHVENPRPPVVLYGDHPSEVIMIAAGRASHAKNKAGRKLRCDSPVIMVGVASWPQPHAVLANDPEAKTRCDHWRDNAIVWLKERWGDNLMSVIEHVDETFPHIHFVIVPPLEADRHLWIGSVHPGHRAERDIAQSGGTKRDQRQAHNAEMKKLQDDYYEDVGVKFGLTRVGPRRQRLTRAEWWEQKRQASVLADAHKKVAQFATDVKAAADHRILVEAEHVKQTAQQKIDHAVSEGERRMAALKQKAAHHLTSLGARGLQLQQELRQREEMIAKQAEELRALSELLRENGIDPAPTM
jgi:hypothetical protein